MARSTVYVPKIDVLGDSIPHGFGCITVAAWRTALYNASVADNNRIHFCGSLPAALPDTTPMLTAAPFHDAQDGDLLANVGARAGSPSKYGADIPIICAGTNDIGAGTTAANTLTAYAALITNVVKNLPWSWCKIICMNILPRNDAFNSVVTTFNAGFAAMIAGHPSASKLVTFDQAVLFGAWSATYFSDAVHLNDTGANVIGNALWPVLKPYAVAIKATTVAG